MLAWCAPMPSPTSLQLSIVIPVWSGAHHELGTLLPAIDAAVERIGVPTEILVCHGGRVPGPDAPALEHVTVMDAKSDGYGDILKTGLAQARGEYVLTLDADFAYAADFLPVMWANRERAEVLIGSRYIRGAVAEMGFGRRLASKTLNWFYRVFLSVPYTDISGGFRLYKRRVIVDIEPLESRGLDILPEILVRALCQGWKVDEVPFWYRGREPWNRTRMARFGSAYLATFGRLLSLRNSVRAADYDNRAFDSWVPLQRMWQRNRFEIVHDFMGAQGGQITLDIGCGSSRIVQTLPGVVGMDLGMHKLRWLRAPGRSLVQGSLTRMPFRDASFDTVLCSEVIEHIPRADVHLGELARLVRPGGLLILGTPDYSRRRWVFLEWLYGKVFPNGYVKEHINHYTRSGLQAELERMGLRVEGLRYVGGSEMIFSARVPADGQAARHTETPSPA